MEAALWETNSTKYKPLDESGIRTKEAMVQSVILQKKNHSSVSDDL